MFFMNTLHLNYAIEVARTRSITLAAENMFMSQPNLSKAIKELEENLGFPIFERSTRGMSPTGKGSEFLIYARNILDQLEKVDMLSNPENDRIQHFNVSIPRSSYIADGFTKFAAELDTEKGVDLNIQETNSMQTISNVIDGQFNLGVIRYQTMYENYFQNYLQDKQLCSEPIWEFEYLVVMSRNHPLADAEEIRQQDLKKYIEIIHGDTAIPYLSNKDNRKTPDSACDKRKIYVYERCSQFDLLSCIPGTYMLVSPIPERLLEKYELIQRKYTASSMRCRDVLIYPKGYKITELDKKFVDKVYEAKNEAAFREYT